MWVRIPPRLLTRKFVFKDINKKEISKKKCHNCQTEISYRSKSGLCSPCFNKNRTNKNNNRKVKNRPSKEQLLKEIKETNYCAVGRKYGVSDNAIRKWLK